LTPRLKKKNSTQNIDVIAAIAPLLAPKVGGHIIAQNRVLMVE